MKPIPHDHPPSQLWILDIDGTLMPSHTVDNACYWQAVNEYFGGVPEALDLQQFQNVTDGSILGEWVEKTRGRTATEAEISRIRITFMELLQKALALEPAAFAARPGLTAWLDRRMARNSASVAIATGGWSHTACFKLQAAGLDAYAFPLASSDDASRRVDIMLHARNLLLQNLPLSAAEIREIPTCYVGDGIWDYRASRELGWDFVGIAEGQRAHALLHAGARHVYCNFSAWLASESLHSAGDREHDART
jgi:phosphoglycolate phosphatase-like HAD superfamily hydrolase